MTNLILQVRPENLSKDDQLRPSVGKGAGRQKPAPGLLMDGTVTIKGPFVSRWGPSNQNLNILM